MYGQANGTAIPTRAGWLSTRAINYSKARHLFVKHGGHLMPNSPARPHGCGLVQVPTFSAASHIGPVFRHPGDLDLNLREYMVVLEKPVGLTLATNPWNGQVVVQDIKIGSPADKSGLIQVGDVVRCCSSVFGEDMWTASDIRRVRWAINSRLGDVRLILQRARGGAGPTVWYCLGKAGVATRERDAIQLPCAFHSTSPEDASSYLNLPGAGRCMQVAFHGNSPSATPATQRRVPNAAAARAAATHRLRNELEVARLMPRLLEGAAGGLHGRSSGPDSFILPTIRSATAAAAASAEVTGTASRGNTCTPTTTHPTTIPTTKTSTSSSSSAAPPAPGTPIPGSAVQQESESDISTRGGGEGGGRGAASPLPPPPPVVDMIGRTGSKNQRVVPFLPWLLVSCGRLEHRHIATLASQHSLGTLLELSLTRGQQQPQQQPLQQSADPPVTTTATAAASVTSGGGGAALESGIGTSIGGTKGNAVFKGSVAETATGGGGAYLVVRGHTLLPLASDVGRVSYPALLAAANTMASEGNGGDRGTTAGAGAPGSAAPLTTFINGAEVVVDEEEDEEDSGRSRRSVVGSSLTADSEGGGMRSRNSNSNNNGSASGVAMNNGITSRRGSSDANSGSGSGSGAFIEGGSRERIDTTSVDSSSKTTNNNNNNNSNSGLVSSTMTLLDRSLFVTFRSSSPGPSSTNNNSNSNNTNMTGGSNNDTSAVAATTAATTTAATTATTSSKSGPPAAANPTPPTTTPWFESQSTPQYDPTRVRHLLNAAASLQRLSVRRRVRLLRGSRDACAVLLHCDEGLEGELGVLLAGWLHWYGRLPLQEAILATEVALDVRVDQGLVEASTSTLLSGALDRSTRAVLTWKYGGLNAYVAGDVVASWAARVPMVRRRPPPGSKGEIHRGPFYLEVQGLRPGVYTYKYIIDGTWAVDSLSAKVLDAAGNWNNVLMVPEPPQALTSREGLALARWQAARLAFEAKMGLTGSRVAAQPQRNMY